MSENRPTPGGGLLHPVPLLAIVLLVLNDHVGKVLAPGVLTGKLSDVAGLLYFPLVLQAGLEVVQARLDPAWHPSRRVLVGCAIACALVFALVQTWDPAGDAYRWGLGALQWPVRAALVGLGGGSAPGLAPVHLTPDPTDLIALPSIGVAVAVGWRRTATPRADGPPTPTRAPVAPGDGPGPAGVDRG